MSTGSANPISTIPGQTSAGQYGFTDPYGVTPQLQNALYGTGGAVSGGALGTYNQNANQVMNQVAGLSGPLQQTLSQTAAYQANNALNATASNFANQGALGSGAGAQAFGQAIANPFAQAQAQLQGSQLSAASGALNNLMGVSGSAYNAGLGQAGNLMEHASGLVAPVNYTNPQYTQQQGKSSGLGSALSGLATGALGAFGGPVLGGLGAGLSSALGLPSGGGKGK